MGSAVISNSLILTLVYQSVVRVKGNPKTFMINRNTLRVLDTTVAELFSSDAAILINRIDHWLSLGYGLQYDNQYWWYSSYREIAKRELTWLSPSQVKRLIKRLKDAGVLIVRKLRSHLYVQTNHYRINYQRLQELISDPSVLSNGRDRPINETKLTNDPITEKTSEKNSEWDGTNLQENCDLWQNDDNLAKEESKDEPDRDKQTISQFHKFLVIELSECEWVNNPKAYSQKIIDNLLRGSSSSELLYEQWKETGTIDISSTQSDPPNLSQNSPESKHKNKPQEKELKEWQIKADDEELINAGYEVGDIYPEFIQWAVPRLKYHPDLTEYASKAHAIKKLKLEPQLALEMWRDFKRLLVRELEDKQKLESKGQRYFTPSWMKLPEDVPINQAKEASMTLNDAKASEQEAIEADRQDQKQLTAGDTDADQEDEPQEDEVELDPVENAKNALSLIQQFPDHPLGYQLLDNAKNKASEDEVEQINQLEDEKIPL